MSTEQQLESVQRSLYHTQVMLIAAIVLAVILLVIFVHYKLQTRDNHYYKWYNPETGWLNRTYFHEAPQRSQIFWADEDFWVIERVDHGRRQLDVSAIDESDILHEVPSYFYDDDDFAS